MRANVLHMRERRVAWRPQTTSSPPASIEYEASGGDGGLQRRLEELLRGFASFLALKSERLMLARRA